LDLAKSIYNREEGLEQNVAKVTNAGSAPIYSAPLPEEPGTVDLTTANGRECTPMTSLLFASIRVHSCPFVVVSERCEQGLDGVLA
jgi:hypothetical protein